jgi:hypothetical protein
VALSASGWLAPLKIVNSCCNYGGFGFSDRSESLGGIGKFRTPAKHIGEKSVFPADTNLDLASKSVLLRAHHLCQEKNILVSEEMTDAR